MVPTQKVNNIICGVPQGSLLGLLLYVCFCNNMKIAINYKFIFYVNDSIIMVSYKDPKVTETKLAIELNSINNWVIENNASLHPRKCESMLFASKRKCKRISDFNVVLNGTTVNAKSNITYRGSVIDRSLLGQGNVSNITKTSNGKLKFIS